MIALKRYTWKSGIALMVLTIWIGLEGIAAFSEAQVQPPRRKRRIMSNPKKESKAEATEVNVRNSLVGIARRASGQCKDKMVDFVFVIERGEKMKKSIEKIEKQLDNVVHVFEASGVDYQLAPIWFQNQGGPKFEGSPFRNDLSTIQEGFDAQFRRDHATGYGLEAIMWGVRELDFRSDARKHMIVVTNSQLRTAWQATNGKH